MGEIGEFALRAALIGIGATAVMDVWAIVQRRLFAIPSLNYSMVGRWIGHLPSGRFIHKSIANSPPVRRELIIGWGAHYAIGIIFAALLLAICGPQWAGKPTLLPALVFGIASVGAPFLILQPGMGAGIAAANTPNPNTARLRSLVAHLSFGIGLYLSALVWAVLLRY